MTTRGKVLLVTTDNHTLGIQTVANAILTKKAVLPEMFYLPCNLPQYPHSIEAKILHHIIREVDESDGKVLIGFQLKELSLGRSIQLASKIKQYRGNKVRLVAGGTYATVDPSPLLSLFDHVVVGNGKGILRVFDAVFEGLDTGSIVMAPPIGFQSPLYGDCWVLDEHGEMSKGKLRPLIHPQYKISNALEIMLGVGCSYSCSYCEVAALRGIFGNRYKISFAEPEQAIELIHKEVRGDSGIDYLYIFDEDFLLKPAGWIERFSSLYAQNIGLPFFIFATPVSVRKWPGKVITLSHARLDTVNMGVQSGNEGIVRSLFGRRESNGEVRACVRFLTDLYVERKITSAPMLDFIILNPYETADDLLATIRLIVEMPTPFDAVMHCMSFFRGTPLYDSALNHGRIPEEYRFRHDLHDFISRVEENELQLDYSKGESLQWLFLNVLLYGMRGLHEVRGGRRWCGSLTETQLREQLSQITRVRYEDILSLAYSLPNPMDGVYSSWEINEKLTAGDLTLTRQEKQEWEALGASTVNA